MIKKRNFVLAIWVIVFSICATVAIGQQGPRAISNLMGRTDSNFNLMVASRAAGGGAQQGPRAIGNLVGRTDSNQNLYVTMAAGSVIESPTVNGQILAADGTALLPTYSFASEPTLGFWRSAAGNVTMQGALTTTGAINATGTIGTSAAGAFGFAGRGYWQAPANGVFTFANAALTIGSEFKVDALPTAGACGTSPAVTAGSTPLAGSIMAGTDTPASCVVVFGGTSFPSAPFCTANVVTTTAASTRAIGTLSTTTQLTLTPATAFAASSTVSWHCISSK